MHQSSRSNNEDMFRQALTKLSTIEQPVKQQLKKMLQDCDLQIRPIPPGPHSLMRAVSDCLYFTTRYWKQIERLSLKKFQRLYEEKSLPVQLSVMKSGGDILSDYFSDPSQPRFDSVNLHLVSLLFKVRVIVYQLSQEGYLQQRTINGAFAKQIDLLRDNTLYQPLYSQTYMQDAELVQGVIYENILKCNPRDSFQNIENENWEHENQEKQPAKSEHVSPQKMYRGNDNFVNQDSSAQNQQQSSFYHNLKTVQVHGSSSFYFNFQNAQTPLAQPNIPKHKSSSSAWNEHQHQQQQQQQQQLFFSNSTAYDEFEREPHSAYKANGFRPVQDEKFAQPISPFPKAFTRFSSEAATPTKPPVSLFLFDKDPYSQPFAQSPQLLPPASLGSHHYTYMDIAAQSPISSVVTQQLSSNTSQNSNSVQEAQQREVSESREQEEKELFDAVNKVASTAQARQAANRKQKVSSEQSSQRYTGSVKFFDEKKNFGYFLCDPDQRDIFVHKDDLDKAQIQAQDLQQCKDQNYKLKFSLMSYMGRYGKSVKAVDIEIINPELSEGAAKAEKRQGQKN